MNTHSLSCRPVSNPVVSRLVASIDKAEESGASQYLLDQARAAAASSAAEVACAEQLHGCSASHSHQGTPEALQLFEVTIKQAKAFPRLEVSSPKGMAYDSVCFVDGMTCKSYHNTCLVPFMKRCHDAISRRRSHCW